MSKKVMLVLAILWFILAIVNLNFAIAGRSNLYYLATGLFAAAGILSFVAWRKQSGT